MTNHTYRLSIEEVAFAIAALGSSDVAAGFLRSIVGDLPADNLSGRLTAASHSLLARGLLSIDLANEQSSLHPELIKIISMFTGAVSSVRCTKSVDGDELTTTYFIGDDSCLEYAIENGVVSRLTLCNSLSDVVTQIQEFANCRGDIHLARVWGKISGESLQALRRLADEHDRVRLKQQIHKILDVAISDELSVAMTDPHAVWGAILLLTTSVNSPEIEANRGIFYLNTTDVTWLFDSTESDTMLTVARGSTEIMGESVHRLLAHASMTKK